MAQKIRKARLQLGCTQHEMAKRVGISRSLLAMAETGQRRLKMTVYDLILAIKPMIYPSDALDHYREKLQTYLDAKKGISKWEGRQLLLKKERRLADMQMKYPKLLAEWSRIEITLQVSARHFTPSRLLNAKNKARKLWIKLHNCDWAAQFTLSEEIYLLKHRLEFEFSLSAEHRF